MTYPAREWIYLDFPYEYSHNAPARIKQWSPQAGSLNGQFETEAHAVGAQVSLRFE